MADAIDPESLFLLRHDILDEPDGDCAVGWQVVADVDSQQL